MPEYYNLYSPAIDFLFHCLGYQATPEIYEGIWLLFATVDGENVTILAASANMRPAGDGAEQRMLWMGNIQAHWTNAFVRSRSIRCCFHPSWSMQRFDSSRVVELLV